jgi:hypothetical protein
MHRSLRSGRAGRAGHRPALHRLVELELRDGRRRPLARAPGPLDERVGGHVMDERGDRPPSVASWILGSSAQLSVAEPFRAHGPRSQVPVRRAGRRAAPGRACLRDLQRGRHMVHTLDHMVIAVRDLDAGIAADLCLLGRPPRWRADAAGGGAETAVYGIVGTGIAALGTAERLPSRAALAADTVTRLGGRSRLLMTVTFVARPSICRASAGPGPGARCQSA